MGKDEKEFFEALSNFAKDLKSLKKELEEELNNEMHPNDEEKASNEEGEKMYSISDIEKILEEATEMTQKEMDEAMEGHSGLPSFMLKLQNFAVIEMFKKNVMEGMNENE